MSIEKNNLEKEKQRITGDRTQDNCRLEMLGIFDMKKYTDTISSKAHQQLSDIERKAAESQLVATLNQKTFNKKVQQLQTLFSVPGGAQTLIDESIKTDGEDVTKEFNQSFNPVNDKKKKHNHHIPKPSDRPRLTPDQ